MSLLLLLLLIPLVGVGLITVEANYGLSIINNISGFYIRAYSINLKPYRKK